MGSLWSLHLNTWLKTLIIHLHYFDSSDLNLAYSIRAYWVNIIIINRGVNLSKYFLSVDVVSKWVDIFVDNINRFLSYIQRLQRVHVKS